MNFLPVFEIICTVIIFLIIRIPIEITFKTVKAIFWWFVIITWFGVIGKKTLYKIHYSIANFLQKAFLEIFIFVLIIFWYLWVDIDLPINFDSQSRIFTFCLTSSNVVGLILASTSRILANLFFTKLAAFLILWLFIPFYHSHLLLLETILHLYLDISLLFILR